MVKSITLCADDYGQNTAISQAIIALLKEKRLSAVSCMTTAPEWPAHARELAIFKDQTDIGVHFNLTEGKPLSSAFIALYGSSFPSLFTLLKKCYLRQLDPTVVYAELNAQLDQFISSMGRLPDFIDGHQHVHQFPIIREATLALYAERLRDHFCYVRSVYDPKAWLRIRENAYIKQLIIQLCGAHEFKKQLIQRNIPHNSSFSGIYNFAPAAAYAQLFPRFLQQSENRGLIMCHPGLSQSQNKDEIKAARALEYDYFQSEQFVAACLQHHVIIKRFSF